MWTPKFYCLGITGCRKLKAPAYWTRDEFSLTGTLLATYELVVFTIVQVKMKVLCCIFHFAFLWLVPKSTDFSLAFTYQNRLFLLLLVKSLFFFYFHFSQISLQATWCYADEVVCFTDGSYLTDTRQAGELETKFRREVPLFLDHVSVSNKRKH